MKCYNCGTETPASFSKFGIDYSECTVCSSVFTTDDITPVLVTENDLDEGRNIRFINKERIDRVTALLGRPIARGLDFGCGNGQLVALMQEYGIEADGIDKDRGTLHGTYDAIFMIEVIEHLTDPRDVLDTLARTLNPHGVIYIETTFAQYLPRPLSHALYVDPTIGHLNVLSWSALSHIKPADVTGPHSFNSSVVYFIKENI